MKYFLVRFSGNYADEFDVNGFSVFTETKLEGFKQANKLYFERLEDDGEGEAEYGFGTNEGLTFRDYEDFISQFNIQEITKEQRDVLKSLNLESFGEFPDFNGY